MPQLRSLLCAAAISYMPLLALAQTDTTKTQQLKEVKVSAQKGAIETAPGKTIVNVQALSGTAGKNALELLRRVPGISVDGRGNITMTGKQGITLMLNGRQTYLSGEELRDLLESMTADEVAQVVVISQPSARYDAEGNAGIIDLKLRRLRRSGINGNVNLAWTKSLYESTHNSALLNYNTGNTNWYTNASYINGRNGVSWQQDMTFTDPAGTPTAHTVMGSEPREMFDKYNLRTGADHRYSESTNAGFSITGAYYANQMNTPIITNTTFPQGDTEYSIRHTNENSLRKNYAANAYLRHSLGKHSDISIDIDHLRNTKMLYQYLSTDAYSNGTPLPHQLTLQSRIPIDIAIYSAKADHSITLTGDMKIESGGKYSYVAVDNAAYFMRHTAGTWMDDTSRTNRFLYHEHISALYANASRTLSSQWSAQAGLRAEYAHITGLQQATGQQFIRRQPALFPTAYISYRHDSANSFELNYGRRITRPQYGMLNPFNYYTFYNTYQRGNPTLLPQYAHNIELKHSYNDRITTELSISKVTNAISWVSMPDNATQTTYGTPINFAGNTTAALGITYNGKPQPWCEMMIHSEALYAIYKGIMNDVPMHNARVGYNIWLNSRLILGSGWDADCYVNYTSPMAASPVSNSIATLYTNFGISKKAFHDTTTIKVSIDDPFYVYRSGNDDKQPGLSNSARLLSNSRYCTMAVTYNFGRKTARTRRNENQPEEARRM
ncbi:outer membrane beta-barrel family protein [Nemorincola caseinilytica]|uniref:Outer membrane beta-barrel family protein n=1 Tax=Nemorincola caseinilytica TaxID=2054315 RepID=A0ABP8NB88_9BACT